MNDDLITTIPGPLKIVELQLFDDGPTFKFRLPDNVIKNPIAWVHELTELSVRLTFASLSRVPIIRVAIALPDGKVTYHRLEHFLASFSTVSVCDINGKRRFISPDKYAKVASTAPILPYIQGERIPIITIESD